VPLGRFKQVERIEVYVTHHLLTHPDYVNLLIGNIHTMKKTEPLVAASKKVDVEVNPEKTKVKFMSHEQNTGHNNYIKIANEFLKKPALGPNQPPT
jgi:hypothetical protein